MKTGNLILDKALQAQKGTGAIEVVKASFYENPISYGVLVNNTVYSLINYTYINILLTEIEAAYNHWNKAIGILEKITDLSKDYNKQKLDGLKEQMYWLNDHGKQARGLDGMIKDAVIFRTGNYEELPGAQQRIDRIYNCYNQSYKSTVSKIEKAFLSAVYSFTLKDTRPLIEKLSPIINQFQSEQATLFTNGIQNHVKPEINLIGLEINILMQLSSSTLQSYFTNKEDPEMIRQLQAQLEQMRQEKDQAITERNEAVDQRNTASDQILDRDRTISEQDAMLRELNNNIMPQLSQLREDAIERERIVDRVTQERDEANQQRDEAIIQKDNAIQQIVDRDRIIADKDHIIADQTEQNIESITKINSLNNTVQDLQNTIINKDNKINELNTMVKDLREASIDSSPQIRNLEHRLEVVNIEKSSLEQILAIREQQVTGLQHDKMVLEQSTTDLKEDKAELRTAKNELTAKNLILEQIKAQLTEGIGNLTTEVATKDSKIEKIMTCYTDYETIMLGCSTCKPHVHAVEFD